MFIELGVFDTLVCWLRWMVGALLYGAEAYVNALLMPFATVLSWIVAILPHWAPDVPAFPQEYIGYVNWLVPLRFCVVLFSAFVVAYGVYRLYHHFYKKATEVVQPKLFDI